MQSVLGGRRVDKVMNFKLIFDPGRTPSMSRAGAELKNDTNFKLIFNPGRAQGHSRAGAEL